MKGYKINEIFFHIRNAILWCSFVLWHKIFYYGMCTFRWQTFISNRIFSLAFLGSREIKPGIREKNCVYITFMKYMCFTLRTLNFSSCWVMEWQNVLKWPRLRSGNDKGIFMVDIPSTMSSELLETNMKSNFIVDFKIDIKIYFTGVQFTIIMRVFSSEALSMI